MYRECFRKHYRKIAHMQQQHSNTASGSENAAGAPVSKIAENPNPRANENITHTSFEEKRESSPGDDVGTEITDGEAG
jgi:hypothetical protein